MQPIWAQVGGAARCRPTDDHDARLPSPCGKPSVVQRGGGGRAGTGSEAAQRRVSDPRLSVKDLGFTLVILSDGKSPIFRGVSKKDVPTPRRGVANCLTKVDNSASQSHTVLPCRTWARHLARWQAQGLLVRPACRRHLANCSAQFADVENGYLRSRRDRDSTRSALTVTPSPLSLQQGHSSAGIGGPNKPASSSTCGSPSFGNGPSPYII